MSNEEDLQDAAQTAEYPETAYTDVKVTPVKKQSPGRLSNGKGTYAKGTFTCGPFEGLPEDLPEVGAHYNIVANGGGVERLFMNWKCVRAGRESEFKAK